MPRRAKRQRLNVWMNGELVGHWEVRSNGRHEFRYAQSWLDAPATRPLSLSLPLQPANLPYTDERVVAFFDNLLPDNMDIRRRIQARFSTSSNQAFDLLTEIGRDCVGAVQLLPADTEPKNIRRIESERLTDTDIEQLLHRTIAPPALGQAEEDTVFRISLAGMQEKTALLRRDGRWHRPLNATPSTHIFKLPLSPIPSPARGGGPGWGGLNVDLSTSVENEWLCAQIIRAYGLPIADCQMASFGDQRVLIVERFDRRWAQHGRLVRLHQEDLAQATGTPSGMKYESDGGPGITKLMTLLRGSTRAASDRVDFFRTLLLQWLLCAIDGHAKNFSVHLEAGGSFRLAPRYDVISVYPALGRGSRKLAVQRVKMAMALWGENRHYRWNEIRRHHFLRTAKDCGLAEAPRLLDELLAAVPQAMDLVASELPSDFPESVSEPIFDGVAKACQMLQA